MKKIALFVAATVTTLNLWAQTTNHTAYSLFVVSFAKYSAWPQPDTEFKIVVVGKSKVYEELIKVTANKNLNGQSYKIVQTENIADAQDAELVYLSDNKSSMLDGLNKATEGKAVMIVTEREGLAKKGAGISLLVIDNKLRFDINHTELEKRQIKVATSLMNLAHESI